MAQGDDALLNRASPETRPASRAPLPVGTISYGKEKPEGRSAAETLPNRARSGAENPELKQLGPKAAPVRQSGGLMAPLIVGGVLLGLIALGTTGILVVKSVREARDIAERVGPAPNLGMLPPMTFSVGPSAIIVDVQARLEFDADVDATIANPYATRITDQISDRLRAVRPDEMRGAAGAQLIKRTIAGAVNQEITPVRVRNVLLDRLVVR